MKAAITPYFTPFRPVTVSYTLESAEELTNFANVIGNLKSTPESRAVYQRLYDLSKKHHADREETRYTTTRIGPWWCRPR
jgi:hypothetical protein